MPFRHVALYRWAEHVDAEHIERVRAAFDALAERVGGVLHLAHGSDAGVSAGTFDYHVVADFETLADWRRYRDHPAHVLLTEELIVGHVAERAGGQFHTEDERSGHAVTSAHMRVVPADSDRETERSDDETDDELLARARRAAMAEMQALLAEPDDV